MKSRPYGKFLVLALGILALLLAVGYLPTRRLGGEAALSAMLAAAGISLLASLAGTVPIVLARGLHQPVSAVMGSMAIRLAVVLFAGAGAALSGVFAVAPLSISKAPALPNSR